MHYALSIGIYALCILMLSCLSMTFTACSDDDDDNKSEQQRQEEAKQAEDMFWDVVGQLTSVENYTEDYKDKTFEATIGQPSSNNPTVRIVSTGDMATAAWRFGNLIGNSSINENTPSFEYKNDAVGTLSYTKTTDGSSLATVDVNIKQLPGLQKIVYCTPEQMGVNGEFRGNAWYRFGDVISREYPDKNDNNKMLTDYWVCVRAACGPAGKETTHWISLSPLPKNNRFEHNGSNGAHYAVPKGISTNTEHMQNFAELMYAIINPHEWGLNLNSNERLPHPKMWHDFKPERYTYNNEYFFERVYRHWVDPQYDIFGKVFGMNDTQFKQYFNTYGLNLLAKGYSWWTTFSWDLTLYEYNYSNGTGAEANMHKETYRAIEKNVKEIKDLDFTGQYTNGYNYLVSEKFFGNKCPRYAIRHATGKDLCGVTPNVHSSIAGTKNGVTIKDVYCYNQVNNIPVNDYGDPDITPAYSELSEPVVGCIIGKDGKFYADLKSAKEYGTEGIAMVTYLGGDKRVEKGSNYNGLAIALDYASQDGTNMTLPSTWSSTDTRNTFCSSQVTNPEDYANVLDGIACTQKLKGGTCHEHHVHPAAKQLNNWKTDLVANLPEGFSRWFVPSIGQWVLTLEGIGEIKEGNNYTYSGKLVQLAEKAGLKDPNIHGDFFTTTENTYDKVFIMQYNTIQKFIRFSTEAKKGETSLTRPMLAFKYGNGGTQDPAAVNPKITTYPAELGYVLTNEGNFFPNKSKAEAANQTPIAIVVYLSNKNDADSSSDDYNGLAVSTNIIENKAWCTDDREDETYTTVADKVKDAVKVDDGLQQTKHLIALESEQGLSFPAAHESQAMPGITKTGKAEKYSTFFLPSVGQWALMMAKLDIDSDVIIKNESDEMTKKLSELFTNAGFEKPKDGLYWTSTTQSKGKAWIWGTNTTNFQAFSITTGSLIYTRPFIAFYCNIDD